MRRLTASAIAGAGGLAFVVLAVRFTELLNATYRFADAASPPLIGSSLRAGFGPVEVPTQTGVGPLWVDALSATLPGHHTLQLLLGPLIALAGVVFVAAGVHRVAGRGAMVIALAIAAAVPPTVLWTLLFQDNHVTTMATTALLGWHLVRSTDRPKEPSTFLLSVIVGLIGGLAYVSDPQLLVAALIPFGGALLLTRQLRRGVALPFGAAVITVICFAIGVLLTQWLMSVTGVKFIDIFAPHADLSGIARGISLSARGLVWMSDGQWYFSTLGPVVVIGVAGAIAMVILPLLAGWRLQTPAGATTRAPAARVQHTTFWGLSFFGLIGALVVSGYSTSELQAHYLSGCFFCVAALAPPLLQEAGTRLRTAGSVILVAVILANAAGIATVDAANFSTPVVAAESEQLLALLQGHHLTRGYAGYWEAFDLTWRSADAIQVWPVQEGRSCKDQGKASVCPYGFSATGRYTPSGGPTFVILRNDDASCLTRIPDPVRFGAATATYTLGRFSVLVYPDDVARHFVGFDDPLCS